MKDVLGKGGILLCIIALICLRFTPKKIPPIYSKLDFCKSKEPKEQGIFVKRKRKNLCLLFGNDSSLGGHLSEDVWAEEFVVD